MILDTQKFMPTMDIYQLFPLSNIFHKKDDLSFSQEVTAWELESLEHIGQEIMWPTGNF